MSAGAQRLSELIAEGETASSNPHDLVRRLASALAGILSIRQQEIALLNGRAPMKIEVDPVQLRDLIVEKDRLRERVDELLASGSRLTYQRQQITAYVRALEALRDALPKCETCGCPATHSTLAGSCSCEAHSFSFPFSAEFVWGSAARALALIPVPELAPPAHDAPGTHGGGCVIAIDDERLRQHQ